MITMTSPSLDKRDSDAGQRNFSAEVRQVVEKLLGIAVRTAIIWALENLLK